MTVNGVKYMQHFAVTANCSFAAKQQSLQVCIIMFQSKHCMLIIIIIQVKINGFMAVIPYTGNDITISILCNDIYEGSISQVILSVYHSVFLISKIPNDLQRRICNACQMQWNPFLPIIHGIWPGINQEGDDIIWHIHIASIMKWKHAILVLLPADGWACLDDPNNLLPVYNFFMEEASKCQPSCQEKIICVALWKQVIIFLGVTHLQKKVLIQVTVCHHCGIFGCC